MKPTLLLALLGALALTDAAQAADPYPNRAIRFIVPQPAGGGVDLLARIIAPKLGEALGGTVVVDNRPGAGGAIGSELAAKSPPDGYTLLMGNLTSHGIYPAAGKLPVDALKDFASIGLVAETLDVLVVHPDLGIASVADLIARAKAAPGKLDYATAGAGSGPHMAGELFKQIAGVDLLAIPYKGTAPAISDTASGQVKIMFPTLPSSITFIQAGKLRALAVTGKQRSPLLPEVPTMIEAGLPGYDVVEWYGVLAPAGLPPELVTRLNGALVAVLAQPEMRSAIAAQGPAVKSSTPDEFHAYMAREIQRWGALIKSANIVIE
ncbi:MAG: tripartite tricarboxylate transporter substrate binding protein [Alphaproteobacteria bacterium]|nr:tripartite tricarboxylate transporter substrate binding protein [Alphaproteobacteria bacterium]